MCDLATQARCRIALGSGPALAPLLDALRALPAWCRLDWPHLHLFAAAGPWDAAAQDRLAALPLPRANVVGPRGGGGSPLEAANEFEHVLRAHFALAAGQLPVFDLLLDDEAARPPERAGQADRLVTLAPGGLPVLSTAVRAAARRRLCLACPVTQPGPGAGAQASTTRSSGAATPATVRNGRSGLSSG
jgi:hypothetical protein